MIEGFYAYIKTIALFLIFAHFTTVLIPDNSTKKYLAVILGVLAAVTIMEPLAKLFHDDFDISQYLPVQEAAELRIMEDAAYYSKWNETLITEIYNGRLESDAEGGENGDTAAITKDTKERQMN